MRRQRDYAAEYRRRVQLERVRSITEERAFSLHRARGHRSSSHEAGERRARKALHEPLPDELAALAALIREWFYVDYGPDYRDVKVAVAFKGEDWVRVRLENQWTTMSYNTRTFTYDTGMHEWETRDDNVPDSLFYYHGRG